jgi:hypothetical protein
MAAPWRLSCTVSWAICSSRSSISSRLTSTLRRHGSGDLQAVERLAAGQTEEVGDRARVPEVISVAWMRFFSVVR